MQIFNNFVIIKYFPNSWLAFQDNPLENIQPKFHEAPTNTGTKKVISILV